MAIVVATHRRPDRLERLLSSLVRQVHDGSVAVVVVDDGSGDQTQAVLRRWQASGVPSVVLHNREPRGPAVARNRGWRAVQSRWVAFTDDDCVATAHWVQALVRRAEQTSSQLVQGRTLPDPDAPPSSSPWARTQSVTSFNDRFQACNLLLSRQLLEQLDGFDERFPFAGEDADLGWRARELGARMSFAQDAIVHHAVWDTSFRQFLASRGAWSDLVRVVARHPGIRHLLVGRTFFRRNHATVLVGGPALLLAGATTSWWVVPVALAVHLGVSTTRSVREGWSASTAAIWAVQALVGAAWESLQFIRASWRHRTLVL